VPSIVIAPNVVEWGVGREHYEGLVSAMEDRGFDARLQEPRERDEYRSGGIVTDQAVDVSIFLLEHVADGTIGALATLAIQRLARRTKRTRKGRIYGPDGEVLREFELRGVEEPD
jgi:hypothetical protein